MELADVLDSKSSGSDTVRVRPPPPAPTKNALLSTDKGAFFELSVPQAEREVCFASEAHFVREVCLRHDMRNT